MTPSLVARLRDGDSAAGRMLTELYREALFRFCWGYLGSSEAADDAVQDICCKVLGAESVPDSFRPWLYKIARNHCLNVRRGLARRLDGQPLPVSAELEAALTGQLTRLERDEVKRRLGELVGSLSESQQEVLRLRYVEGLSRDEISDILELSDAVVKSRLFEGMKKLRDRAAGLRERS